MGYNPKKLVILLPAAYLSNFSARYHFHSPVVRFFTSTGHIGSREKKTLGVSDCFGHESENKCKPVAALFCVTMEAAPALRAAPTQLLTLLYLLMPPFLKVQSRSEILLSLGAAEWSWLCFRSTSQTGHPALCWNQV